MKTYPGINEGRRHKGIRVLTEPELRLQVEQAIYDFISDYAQEMGMSRSGAVRRLLLIGARCESEHGRARMPASFDTLILKISKRR